MFCKFGCLKFLIFSSYFFFFVVVKFVLNILFFFLHLFYCVINLPYQFEEGTVLTKERIFDELPVKISLNCFPIIE